MGAVRFKADMYKQGLFLIALVFLSTSVRSSPLKTAEDPPSTDKPAPAGGDEDKKGTDAPVEPAGGGDGGDNGGEEKPHKADETIDEPSVDPPVQEDIKPESETDAPAPKENTK